MKRIVFCAFLFLLLLTLCIFSVPSVLTAESAGTASEENRETKGDGVHSISELNLDIGQLDSHAGVTDLSTLEVDLRRTYLLENDTMISDGSMWYPRLKKLSTGEYILFFQDGRWGPNVYYTRSRDGLSWDEPTLLFESHPTYNDTYTRYYATADAIELSDGRIVVAAIFHASRKNASSPSPSRWLMTEKGIVTKYSTDGGDSWSESQIVYHGRCWEPSFLELPDGTVQMYFTHSGPKDAIYGTQMGDKVSSGVGMLTSTDKGESWSPMALEYPYVATRIAQQPIFEHNGIQILTDQMPSAILLHDNKTIAMSVESLRPDESGHSTSVIRSHDFFSTVLGEDEYGPEDRDDMLVVGASPYIAQFPSGEVALSTFSEKKEKVYLGNETAEEFYLSRSFIPFPQQKVHMWGDIFVADSHTLLASSGDTIIEEGVINNLNTRGVGISHMILNHRIDAKRVTPAVDGYTADWSANTDALFVGSISQAQTSMRLAHDDENVYLLFELLDYTLTSDDYFYFYITDGSNVKYRIKGTPAGVTELLRFVGSKSTAVAHTAAVQVYGTIDKNGDTDKGYALEIAIPKKGFFTSDTLRVFIMLYNNDGGATYAWDGFNGLTKGDEESWHMVRLSDADGESSGTTTPRPSGDLDGNYTVNNTDLTLLVRYLSGYVNAAFEADYADLDSDGRINNRDAIALVKLLGDPN